MWLCTHNLHVQATLIDYMDYVPIVPGSDSDPYNTWPAWSSEVSKTSESSLSVITRAGLMDCSLKLIPFLHMKPLSHPPLALKSELLPSSILCNSKALVVSMWDWLRLIPTLRSTFVRNWRRKRSRIRRHHLILPLSQLRMTSLLNHRMTWCWMAPVGC